MRTILKYTAKVNDSPIGTKVEKLRDQIHRRKQRLELYNLSSNNNNASNVAQTFKNEKENEKNLPNFFLPNSGIIPELGSVGTLSTVPLTGMSGTGTLPDFGSKEQCQRTLDFSQI
jgi:hypothetical protein